MKKDKILILFSIMAILALATPCFADPANPDITTGLGNVDAKTLADKILKIFIGIGALSGVVATAMLIFLGFKLKGGENARMKAKEHILYVFIGLGVVALSVVFVGFAAFLIKGAT
ncbi:TrbC/VirB2 family protein [Desulforamulus reducens]|nr:TrbC/VirB2 family protein [Desulforamulus reducens]